MAGAEFPVRAVLDDKGIDQLIASMTKAGKAAGMTEKEIKDINDELRRTGRQGPQEVNKVNKSFDSLNSKINNGAKLMLTYFAVDRVIAFGKQIINVTAEFQKLFAVLENTLGSKGLARAAFQDITEFASKTPFQVNEITDAFVRLANRGFVPTREQLRQIGDLAASQGKSFTQLVEAILDGMTLEFERLKEFGIKAKQTNDSVIFSFKGVRTEVARNEEAIRNYLLALGDVEGVAGGMEAVSKTLGGQISNLSDSFDRLFFALGQSSTGIIAFVLRQLGSAVDLVRQFIEEANEVSDPFAGDRADAIKKAVDEFEKLTKPEKAKAINEIAKEVMEWRRRLEELTSAHRVLSEESGTIEERTKRAAEIMGLSVEDTLEIMKKYNFELLLTQSNLTEVEEIFKLFMKEWEKLGEVEPVKTQLGLIDQLTEKLKELELRKRAAFSETEIFLLNNEIRRTREELKRLEGLGGFDDITESVKRLNFELSVNTDKAFKNFEKSLKKFTDEYKKSQKDLAEIEAQRLADKQFAQKYAKETEIAAIQGVLDYRINAVQQEINMMEMARQRELDAAGNNEEAKIAINKKFDRERARLMDKQVQREQQAAIFAMLIQQGPAIAKTIANIGMPWAIPFVAALGALLALQLQNTKSAAPPRFARGKFNLQGPGTSTSDSIPAYLSKGESVVTARRSTGRFSPVVQALVEGTDRDVERAMTTLQLRSDVLSNSRSVQSLESELAKANEKLERIANKQETHFMFSEKGFSTWTKKGLSWTRYASSRYRA